MKLVYLGLGSNLGNRENFLKNAVTEFGSSVVSVSNIYETEPYGGIEQPAFYNMVISVAASESTEEIFKNAKLTEKKLGRKERERWGPREIDIDILLTSDGEVITGNELTVPHPDMLNRVFVLLPFCDIAPEAVHPLTGKTIQEHCTGLLNNYKGNLPVNTGINVSGFRDEF